MRIAIISDIHANLEALTAVMADIRNQRIDRIACLGDVVGYGASPNECCDIVRKEAAFCLLGNHDAATIGAMDEAYYYDAARHVLRWTRDRLSETNYRWLYGLPYTRMEGELAFFHSAPVMPSAFFYVVNTSEAQTHSQVFPKLRSLNFIGHAHLTTLFSLNSRKAKVAEARQVALRDETKYILNVGSVGQPRDRDPRACYAIWDSEQEQFEHVRLEYDIETAAGKVVDAGLDEKFAKRLYMGI